MAKNIFFVLILLAAGIGIGYKLVLVPKREEVVFFIFIVSLLPILKYYKIGVVLIFILAPFIPWIRRVYYLAYARPQTDLLILVPDIILVITIIGYLFATMNDTEEDPLINKLKKVLVLFFVFLFARVFLYNTGLIKNSLLQFRFYGPFVLSFFLGTACVKNFRLIQFLGTFTIVTGIITAIYGIKQLFFGFSQAENMWLNSVIFDSLFIQGIPRPFSTFASPASFADFQQMAMIAAAGAALMVKRRINGIFLYVFIFLFGYAMLITSVRSSWIGAIAGVGIWILVLRKQGNQARIAGIIGILVLFAAGSLASEFFGSASPKIAVSSLAMRSSQSGQMQNVMNLFVKQRLSAVTNPLEEHSMTSRITLWTVIIKGLEDPMMILFGRGLGRMAADSLYFTYLGEFGVPGLIFLCYILILFIRGGFKNFDSLEDLKLKALARSILCMNFILLIVNITGNHINEFPGNLYFWFWNGVLLKLNSIDSSKEINSASPASS